MKNCPSVLPVALIVSVLLPCGYSFPYERYQSEYSLYGVEKDSYPDYGGDWNSRKTLGDEPYIGLEDDGWGQDYGKGSDDWLYELVWDPEKVWRGEGLSEVKEMLPNYWGQEDWDQKDWDQMAWRQKDSWDSPPLESWKKYSVLKSDLNDRGYEVWEVQEEDHARRNLWGITGK